METLFRGIKPYILLTLLCLAALVPGQASLPPLDRDESRFAQATRQMLESGDYIRIWFQDQPRHKKPAGIYWLQAAAVETFSDKASTAIWPYRLPSALAIWLTVLATFGLGRKIVAPHAAFTGAAMLGGSLLLGIEGHQAKTDAVLLLLSAVSQGILGWFYLHAKGRAIARPGTGAALAFWLAQGAGVLVKGPIVPLLSALTLLVLAVSDRGLSWFKSLKPLSGLLVACAVFVPWLVAVSGATGGAFMGEAVKSDLLPKLLGAQESHGAPPGYYLALASILLWPGSLYLWPALGRAWKERADPAVKFLLAWSLPFWLLMEIVPTKLPHYTLPAYPALALLAGAYVYARQGQTGRGFKIWAAIWSLIGLALAFGLLFAAHRHGGGIGPTALLAALLLLAGAAWPLQAALAGHHAKAAMRGAVAGAAVLAVTLGFLAPSLDDLAISRRAAALIREQGPEAGPIASAGYSEPSLVFLLGTSTLLTGGGGAAGLLAGNPKGLALVEAAEERAFRQTLGDLAVRELGLVEGLNYSRGKRVRLVLYARGG